MNLLGLITLSSHWDSDAVVVHKTSRVRYSPCPFPAASTERSGWQEDHCVWECSPRLADGMSQGEERRQRGERFHLAVWTIILSALVPYVGSSSPEGSPSNWVGSEGTLFFPCLFFSFSCSVVAVLLYSLREKHPELCWTWNNKCTYLKHWQLFGYKFIFKLRLVSSGHLDETPDIFCGHGVFFRVTKVLLMGACSVTFF